MPLSAAHVAFFGSLYPQCITLRDTPDRTARAQAESVRWGIDGVLHWVCADRFPAERGGGIAGCRDSHTQAIRRALRVRPRLRWACILEDDWIAGPRWPDALDLLQRTLETTPCPLGRWDVLKFFGEAAFPLTAATEEEASSLATVPLTWQRGLSSSTLGYVLSRRFMKRWVREHVNRWPFHVDYLMMRMTTRVYHCWPFPWTRNADVLSTIDWFAGAGPFQRWLQQGYQRGIAVERVQALLTAYHTWWRRWQLYTPRWWVRMWDACQPGDAAAQAAFLQHSGQSEHAYEHVYRCSIAVAPPTWALHFHRLARQARRWLRRRQRQRPPLAC